MPDRTLRAGIVESDVICSLSEEAELFYRRIMSIVDDWGRFEVRPQIIRTRAFPLNLDRWPPERVMRCLQECAARGAIQLYEVNGNCFLQIQNFKQRLYSGRASKFPEPPGECGQAREVPAFARASNSYSKVDDRSSVETTTTPEVSPAAVERDELFERYFGAHLAAGVAVNEFDRVETLTQWARIEKPDRQCAADWAAATAPTRDPGFMGLPQNNLRKRPWTRRGPGRILPPPRAPTKAQRAQEEAAERFRQEGSNAGENHPGG